MHFVKNECLFITIKRRENSEPLSITDWGLCTTTPIAHIVLDMTKWCKGVQKMVMWTIRSSPAKGKKLN